MWGCMLMPGVVRSKQSGSHWRVKNTESTVGIKTAGDNKNHHRGKTQKRRDRGETAWVWKEESEKGKETGRIRKLEKDRKSKCRHVSLSSLSPFFFPWRIFHLISTFLLKPQPWIFRPCSAINLAFFFYYFHLSSAKVISHALSNLSHQNQSVSHAPSKTSSMEFHSRFEGGIKKKRT